MMINNVLWKKDCSIHLFKCLFNLICIRNTFLKDTMLLLKNNLVNTYIVLRIFLCGNTKNK